MDISPQEAERRGKGHAFADRWLIPIMALAVALFASVSIIAVVANSNQVITFDPLEYSPQTIERLGEDGTLVVPGVPGFEPPAIRLGDTVPVRGTMTNHSDHQVSTSGSVVWQVEPPGPRFTVVVDSPGVINVGITQLRFENPIPPEVEEYVELNGPTQFSIGGRVQVLEPGGVDATWRTATFTLVP